MKIISLFSVLTPSAVLVGFLSILAAPGPARARGLDDSPSPPPKTLCR